MKLKTPRIEPLDPSVIPEELLRYMSSGPGAPVLNIFRTVAQHAKLAKRWLVFGTHIMGKSSLPARDRELVVLRTGWLCGSEYEWAQHSEIARDCKISDAEILRVAEGPNAKGWSTFDAALLRATDELHEDCFISDATWQALGTAYGHQEMIDLIFTVGQYTMVSMALNSLGVQLEAGQSGWPAELRKSARG